MYNRVKFLKQLNVLSGFLRTLLDRHLSFFACENTFSIVLVTQLSSMFMLMPYILLWGALQPVNCIFKCPLCVSVTR